MARYMTLPNVNIRQAKTGQVDVFDVDIEVSMDSHVKTELNSITMVFSKSVRMFREYSQPSVSVSAKRSLRMLP
jgi:hypothetical protein